MLSSAKIDSVIFKKKDNGRFTDRLHGQKNRQKGGHINAEQKVIGIVLLSLKHCELKKNGENTIK